MNWRWRSSAEKEKGCLHFDVLLPVAGGDRLALLEVYRSKEVFLAHVETPHCQKVPAVTAEAASDKLVMEVTVQVEL